MKLRQHRRSPIAVLALTALFAAVSGAGSAAGTDRAASAANSSRLDGQATGAAPALEAKKCTRVKKRVKGKVRKVRVCKHVKAAPSLPSKVSVTLDSAHATTASISADSGATLSAGSATLTVPAGAVDETTSVRMTPVARLGGLRGQILGAVQVQPDGLRLLRPVTLTIDVPSTSGLEAFSYAGSGRDFHLYPLKIEGGKAILTLFHFSGHGVAKRLPPPAEVALRTRLNTVIRPAVDSAQRDSGNFDLAVLVYSSWKAEVDQLAPAKRKQFEKGVSALEKGLGAALRKLADDQHKLCVDEHKIVETGKKINYARDLVEPIAGSAGPLADASDYAVKQRANCERFELDFDSRIMSVGPGAVVDSRVRVHGLQLISDNVWENQKLLDYWSFEAPPNAFAPLCSRSVTLGGREPFKAILDPVSDWYAGRSPPLISMEVYVGGAGEVFTYDCEGDSTIEPQGNGYWEGGMAALHEEGLRWTIRDWNYVGDSVFAQRTYIGTKDVGEGIVIREDTTFTLRHTPQ